MLEGRYVTFMCYIINFSRSRLLKSCTEEEMNTCSLK